MRRRIKDVGERDRTFLPLWMRSIQDKDFVESGYVAAMILCYVNPGLSQKIISRIKGRTEYASRGNWDFTSFYRINDTVLFNGNIYTSITNHISNNSNINPETNTDNWVRNFNFRSIDFTVDRYLIDILDGQVENKYLAFPQRGEKLP
jgi:hypothetical protein